jgi:hypothetical protein
VLVHPALEHVDALEDASGGVHAFPESGEGILHLPVDALMEQLRHLVGQALPLDAPRLPLRLEGVHPLLVAVGLLGGGPSVHGGHVRAVGCDVGLRGCAGDPDASLQCGGHESVDGCASRHQLLVVLGPLGSQGVQGLLQQLLERILVDYQYLVLAHGNHLLCLMQGSRSCYPSYTDWG